MIAFAVYLVGRFGLSVAIPVVLAPYGLVVETRMCLSVIVRHNQEKCTEHQDLNCDGDDRM